ncbi:MAG TPA: ABC transporter permease [Puia sp.]
MIKSYLVAAVRNMIRNKVFTIINISGLSLGLSAALIIFLIVRNETSFDKFHPDGANIYRVVVREQREGDLHAGSGIPLPLIGAVKREVPGVTATVPMILCDDQVQVGIPGEGSMASKPVVFREQSGIIFTDSGYFGLTPYNWLAGSSQGSLSEPDKVVLTASRAAAYFPNLTPAEAIGRTVILYDSVPLTVTGIVADLTANTDFVFKAFVSMPTLSDSRLAGVFPLNEWGARDSNYELFLRLNKGYAPVRIERQLQQILMRNAPVFNQGAVSTQLLLEPLSELHLSDEYGSFYSVRHGNKGALVGFLVLAGILLALACTNFINLTTARASERAREIGIRKTFGGSRRQLIIQFLVEALMITTCAAILSLLLIPFVLTFFRPFVPPGLSIKNELVAIIVIFLIPLVIVVAFLSGLYPAFVLSAFRPVLVLKGQSTLDSGHTQKSLLRRIFSISQFSIAQLFLIVTLGVGWQIGNMLKGDKGLREQAILFFNVPGNTDSLRRTNALLAAELRRNADIESVSLSAEPPTSNQFSAGIFTYHDGHKYVEANVQLKFVDTNYLRLYGISLLAGRNAEPGDTMREFVINETYARMMGFAHPADALNRYITAGPAGQGTANYLVVGVVRDFNTHFLLQKPSPVALTTAAKECHTLHVAFWPQTANGAGLDQGVLHVIKAFRKFYPDTDLKYQFFDESIASAYKNLKNLNLLLKWATGVSIFVSCLGMFGLVLFTTAQRMKEIGVRKVLGATSGQIVTLLSKDFMRPVWIATVIASSLGGTAIHFWLRNISDRSLPPLWLFPMAALTMIGLALVILCLQTVKAAGADPVKTLRSE